jgi:hypothetical protein
MLPACVDGTPASAERAAVEVCTPAGTPKPLIGLPEASGAALSRRSPGVVWSHNDSGQPVLHAFDAAGTTRGRVRIPNAAVEDWEDVSVAACPGGSCLYIADIGDNDRARRTITIYRIPEPHPQDAESGAADVFTAVYPDGAHDAEALFVAADDLFIATKDVTAGLYRFPTPLRTGAAMTLERVTSLPYRRVTDAETSSDGAWVAIRTNDAVGFHRTADLVRGKSGSLTMPLRALKEPQGEGVALDANGMVYLTGEGPRAGTLNTLRCTLPGSGARYPPKEPGALIRADITAWASQLAATRRLP